MSPLTYRAPKVLLLVVLYKILTQTLAPLYELTTISRLVQAASPDDDTGDSGLRSL